MRYKLYLMLIIGLFFGGKPGFSHHSFPGIYDTSQQLVLRGDVTRFLFRNPHAFIYLSVTNDAGTSEEWHLEMPPAVALSRGGMTAEAVRAGDQLVVTCNPARDGARSCGLGERGGFARAADGFVYGRDPRQDTQ